MLLRADLNVPMQDGKVSDATRIERLAPTINELLRQGRPRRRHVAFRAAHGATIRRCRCALVAPALSQALGGRAVAFAEDCIGPAAKRVVAALAPGGVALLENLRFHPEEEANDPGFARALAALGDLYVNDAFSAAHRAHASTEAIAHLLPAAAGRLMQAELEALAAVLETPAAAGDGDHRRRQGLDQARPALLSSSARSTVLVIGGAMANTLLAAQGIEIGTSLAERDMARGGRAG